MPGYRGIEEKWAFIGPDTGSIESSKEIYSSFSVNALYLVLDNNWIFIMDIM